MNTMLVLANTLLLSSITLVLSLDVPAEVKEDMVDFGGSVLRKSGLVYRLYGGAAATLGKQGSCKQRNKENHLTAKQEQEEDFLNQKYFHWFSSYFKHMLETSSMLIALLQSKTDGLDIFNPMPF